MTQLLLEILSEEIPARMQEKAAADLERLVTTGLKDRGLAFSSSKALVTPRRLVLVVEGLPTAQPDVKQENKGPKIDAPEQAIAGFLKANGLASVDEAEKREMPKGTFLFAVKEVKGRATAEVLKEIIEAALTAFPWPKSMRWGRGATKWVRPLHSILCVFGGAVVPVEYAGVTAGNQSRGHRFLSPGSFTVTDYTDYITKTIAAKVMVDPDERATIIKAEAEGLAEKAGLTLEDDPGLLKEVTGLVEWPVVLMGDIDATFMEVPQEVLTTAMRAHQKYFSCLNKDGSLAPKFIVVSNMETEDEGAAIIAGNERVLRARLSDAKFFWDQDLKKPLDTLVPKLKDIVFHANLGTVAEKVDRMIALADSLAKQIGADPDQAVHAARLCKADLVTEMVFEFPEVQGTMGRYYALKGGEKPEVANAIAEHYSPAGPSDACPTAPVSVAVALADKIDTLCGFWAIDEKPTGSKDPFALRRAALGVIRLILENGLRLNLLEVFRGALAAYKNDGTPASDLLSFFADRLKVHLKEQGVRHDLISAVFALGGEDDLVRLLARVEALSTFLKTDDGANLLAAHKRAANIVRIEEKKDKASHGGAVDAGILQQAEEKDLFTALEEVQTKLEASLAKEDFAGAMAALATLRKPVDAFFDKVTVNSEETNLRANRLRLLSQIVRAMGGVADFSEIEG